MNERVVGALSERPRAIGNRPYESTFIVIVTLMV